MGLMNAIGLQPRNPAPSVTSQGTQTPIIQLQNAETQTERDLSEPGGSQQPPSKNKNTPSTENHQNNRETDRKLMNLIEKRV